MVFGDNDGEEVQGMTALTTPAIARMMVMVMTIYYDEDHDNCRNYGAADDVDGAGDDDDDVGRR